MADRMAYWVRHNWKIRTETDLIAILLMWRVQSDYFRATSGHGLLAGKSIVLSLSNLGVGCRPSTFYATGKRIFSERWTFILLVGDENICSLNTYKLNEAKEKAKFVPRDAFTYLFEIPLVLAEATLDAWRMKIQNSHARRYDELSIV